MNRIINKWYKNHALIYKVILFLSTTFFIVYLFPKSGKFKYSFDKGKPWQSESLYAPFNFAVKKTKEELDTERRIIFENSPIYFNVNSNIKEEVLVNYKNKFNSVFVDSLTRNKLQLYAIGKSLLDDCYKYGEIGRAHV